MKILILMNAFKENIESWTIGRLILNWISATYPEAKITYKHIADWWDGTLDAFKSKFWWRMQYIKTLNAYGEIMKSRLLINKENKFAVIESAEIVWLKKTTIRDVLRASSYWLWQAIKFLIKKWIKDIYIWIWWTACADLWLWMIQALWTKYYQENNREIIDINLSKLKKIKRIDTNKMYKFLGKYKYHIIWLCDGKVALSDKQTYLSDCKNKWCKKHNYKNILTSLENTILTIKNEYNKDISRYEYWCCWWGIAAWLELFLKAKNTLWGYEIINKLNIEKDIKKNDIVITWEAIYDKNTTLGKLPKCILEICKKHKKKIIIVCAAYKTEFDVLQKEWYDIILKTLNNKKTFEEIKKNSNLSLYNVWKEIWIIIKCINQNNII